MNLPNRITISRIILVVLLFLGLFAFSFVDVSVPVYGPTGSEINLVYLIVFVIFVVAASTDFLDGHIARSRNLVTDLGKFLDPIADKMLVNSTLIFLCVQQAYCSPNQIYLNVFVVIVFVVRDLIVDTVRFMAAKKNIVIAANIFGKLKTVAQMIAIPVVLLNGFPFSYFDAGWPKGLRIADFFVYIALFFSVLSGVIYVIQNKNVFLKTKIYIDDKSFNKMFNLLKEKGLTIGTAESFTGGLFASTMTQISGASAIYKGSVVSYSSEVKENILNVNKEVIAEKTVVSKEVAEEMALNGLKVLNVDLCVSFTGNAGPTSDKGDKKVGLYYIGIADKNGVEVYEFYVQDERNNIQNKAINDAVEKIIKKIV